MRQSRTRNLCMLVIICTGMSGCYTTESPTVPKLDAYLNTKPDANSIQVLAAREDLRTAYDFCRTIHNNYEANSKKAEAYKLAVGAGGGFSGSVVGPALAAGGSAAGVVAVFSGIAGLTSTVLATAKEGPLDTSFYSEQKKGIAAIIHDSASKAATETDPLKIHGIASSLMLSCLAKYEDKPPKS